MFHRFRPALVITALTLCTSPLAAQDGQDEAIDLTEAYERAAARAARNDISGAIRGFKAILEQDPYWASAAYNVGYLSEHIDIHSDCALYFRRYLVLEPEADDRDEVLAQIAECEDHMAESGTVTITGTTPAELPVMIDGLELGRGAFGPIALRPGEHTVTATRTDFEPFLYTFEVVDGSAEQVNVALWPVVYFGTVTFEVDQAGAEIYLDGNLVGTVPLTEPLRLAAGQYAFEVRKAGFHPWRRNIEVRRDDTIVTEVRLIDERVDLDSL